jgi:hypothetical protein
MHCHRSLLAPAMDLAREASFPTDDPMPYWLDAFGNALNGRVKREGNANKLGVALNSKKAKTRTQRLIPSSSAILTRSGSLLAFSLAISLWR